MLSDSLGVKRAWDSSKSFSSSFFKSPGSASGSSVRQSDRVINFEREKRTEELGHVKAVSRSIEFLVDDPIACGYLKLFCEMQFNLENVYFVMEIGKFKDLFAVDAAAWGPKDWKTLDVDVHLKSLPPIDSNEMHQQLEHQRSRKTMWPSTLVSQTEVESKVKWIWDNFFSGKAEFEICSPSHVLENTMKRLMLLHIYGASTFDEAMLDPLKTLKRDIYPRFIVSDLAQDLYRRLDSLTVLPSAESLRVDPPSAAPICQGLRDEDVDTVLETVDLSATLSDKVLYEGFLSYLNSIVSSENLLCVRMINNFKELTQKAAAPVVPIQSSNGPAVNKSVRQSGGGGLVPPKIHPQGQEALEQAWLIYLYFVHPGSVHEVALSHRRRKELRLNMANPKIDTFDRLEKSGLDTIKVHFQTYRFSSSWKMKLRSSVRSFIELRDKQSAPKKSAPTCGSSACCGWW